MVLLLECEEHLDLVAQAFCLIDLLCRFSTLFYAHPHVLEMLDAKSDFVLEPVRELKFQNVVLQCRESMLPVPD